MNDQPQPHEKDASPLPQSGEMSTPVSMEGTSAGSHLPPKYAQMFERKYDWEAEFLAFREWVADGRGSDKAFALSRQMPYGSFARHAAKFRRKMAQIHAEAPAGSEVPDADGLKAAPFSSLPTPLTLSTSQPPAGLGSRDRGPQLLAAASPAPELLTPEAKATERGFRGAVGLLRRKAPDLARRLLALVEHGSDAAAVASIKEAFAQLKDAEKESPTASPFETMELEEVGLFLHELWPVLFSEREVVVDLKEKGS